MTWNGSRTRVKVCCIASVEEARLAIDLGADALGLVGAMPSGPGIISDETAREIAEFCPPAVSTFLLTSETVASAIAEHVRDVGASAVQIVNHIDPAESIRLVDLIPDIRRVQVIHVEDESAIDLLAPYASYNHAFLLDSGKPNAIVPTLGGTGQTHDWQTSKAFVERSPLPVFLAGGLKPENVREAIRQVRPFGLDLCSGVRSNDHLDPSKLKRFFDAVSKKPD